MDSDSDNEWDEDIFFSDNESKYECKEDMCSAATSELPALALQREENDSMLFSDDDYVSVVPARYIVKEANKGGG